ncbi:unnamed protein product [Lupinus luteus]|uniref:Uncharacterized protein n=1 Tax=Lupinus luteus TaxID=3873 RepID=A0AAV1XHG1_LUPLU
MMTERSRNRFLGATIVGRGNHTYQKRLIYYIWDDGISLVASKKSYLYNRLVFLRGNGMAYSHVNSSVSFLVSLSLYSLVFFIMLVHKTPASLMLNRSFPNQRMNLTEMRKIDMQRHGRILQSSIFQLPILLKLGDIILRQNYCL